MAEQVDSQMAWVATTASRRSVWTSRTCLSGLVDMQCSRFDARHNKHGRGQPDYASYNDILNQIAIEKK
ncbi:hypothetical protein [Paracoccus fistulariae]|uniref:Uncharacterized protein n=1 Tax=Paracoccus fistulariae TaxID=658446 RepID=A0ABY7SJY9_9RHOB|nr:hypothetical protein [Paracoccus fistulariae]MDB6181270.1 hypothetical protein [Paracoccus fistulariae]WCR07321.1 hypothetical protein JHX87_00200 [Paracoccus fistulariae]